MQTLFMICTYDTVRKNGTPVLYTVLCEGYVDLRGLMLYEVVATTLYYVKDMLTYEG